MAFEGWIRVGKRESHRAFQIGMHTKEYNMNESENKNVEMGLDLVEHPQW